MTRYLKLRIYRCRCHAKPLVRPDHLRAGICRTCNFPYYDYTESFLCEHCNGVFNEHTAGWACLFSPTMFKPHFLNRWDEAAWETAMYNPAWKNV